MKSRCSDCCHPQSTNPESCGCCEGIEIVTPLPIRNRPGLSELVYRIGHHGSFLETMTARLSGTDYPALAGLTTRGANDASLALLDSWATVADVLTFYQERIANEGYLRTATERRSVLELANLVGYTLRPGVSASVFLAYTIDDNTQDEVIVPKGSKAQSIPGPGELPQLFETGADIAARAAWNNLQPRLSQPQTRETIRNAQVNNSHAAATIQGPRLYLKGVTTNLKPNDPLLIDFGDGSSDPEFSRVIAVYPDADADRTLLTLSLSEAAGEKLELAAELDDIKLIKELTQPPSIQRQNALQLRRDLSEQFSKGASAGYGMAAAFVPELRTTLSSAFGNAAATANSAIRVYALRTKASLFGSNHPGTPSYQLDSDTGMINITSYSAPTLEGVWPSSSNMLDDDGFSKIAIDPPEDKLIEGSWIVIERPALDNDCSEEGQIYTVHKVSEVHPTTFSAFGISSKVTLIGVNDKWLADLSAEQLKIQLSCGALLRGTSVYGLSEELELAEEPIEAPVCGGTEDLIELDGFYEGLESGRWVVVSGERELAGTSGVRFSELAMLSSVTQSNESRPGEKIHTFIKLAEKLAYCFKRDTVTLHGNVVKATHGETRLETLGSGNGSKALQWFELKQKP
ncbi:MAG: hypothetical protein ACTHWH_18550, partial [Marinobacter sp.]